MSLEEHTKCKQYKMPHHKRPFALDKPKNNLQTFPQVSHQLKSAVISRDFFRCHHCLDQENNIFVKCQGHFTRFCGFEIVHATSIISIAYY